MGDVSLILSEELSDTLQGSVEAAMSSCGTLITRKKREATEGKRQDAGKAL